MKKFDLQKSFHHGARLIHAGVYRVPMDMAEDVAERARRDGLGAWIAEPKPAAPITKSLGPAPENKSMEVPADQATFPAAGPSMARGNRSGQRAIPDGKGR